MIRLIFLPPNLIALSRPIAVAVICYYLINDPELVLDGYVGLALFLFFYWASDYLDGIVARMMMPFVAACTTSACSVSRTACVLARSH